MESIAKTDPTVRLTLDAYNRFHMDPDLRFIAESCEDHERDVNAYGETKKRRE